MTDRMVTPPPATATARTTEGSYVDWPAIFAGASVAAAIAFAFSTFGAAIGLSISSPYDGDGSAIAALLAVGTWMLWTAVSSFAVGGYISGRMRRRVDAATEDEVAVRDGIHGLTVWAAAILLGVFVLGGAADTAAMTIASDPTLTDAEMAALAETTRIYSVLSAFVIAAALFVSAAAAYWAAGVGGNHRDDGTIFPRFGRWT